MQCSRDEYLAWMNYQGTRPIFVELFGPLAQLETEWRGAGVPEDEIGLTAFGFDWVLRQGIPVHTHWLQPCPQAVIEETEEHIVRTDGYGRRSKLIKAAASIPLPLDHPVTDMDSWLRVKHQYRFDESRFAPEWAETAKQARADGALIVLRMPGGFDEPRQLLGEEAVCLACYDNPEMLHDMRRTLTDLMTRIADRVTREVTVDVLSVHEDMAGKSGPLFGPPQIEEFVAPYYRSVWDVVRSRGGTLFQQDSDGNLNGIVQTFLDAGLNCMLPNEPAAGMDIVAMRKTYGRDLRLMGGIDKHVLRLSRAHIDRELEYKLQPLMREGGAIFGLDHRIPNGTPIENYRYYVRRAREILGLDPNPPPGWQRMAF